MRLSYFSIALKTWTFVLFSSAVLTGCGDDTPTDYQSDLFGQDDSKLTETAEEEESFSNLQDLREYTERMNKRLAAKKATKIGGTILVSGGFSTCTGQGPYGAEIYKRLLTLLWKRAADKEYFRVVGTCFKKSGKYVYYFSSSELNEIRWGVPADIAGVVSHEVNLAGNKNLYLLGHSYGGWLALRTAVDISKEIAIKGLVSIDPISRTYCTPGVFARSYFRSAFSFNPAPDCNRSPRDFTVEQTAALRKRVGWWENFYQDNSGFLHSSPMNHAQNRFVEYNYTGVLELVRAHGEIAYDNRVWSVFESRIKAD